MRPLSVVPDMSVTPSSSMDAIDEVTTDAVPLTLQTFGAARIMLGDQTLGMHNALLFMLVLRMAYAPTMAVRRDTVLEEFWPDQDEVRQRGNLRQALYKLRTLGVHAALRGDVIQLDTVQVRRTFSLVPSIESFERDITCGSEPYGTFLPDITPPTTALQGWIERTRETMHGAVRRVLVEVLRLRRERADWKGTQMVAQWLLQLDPLNEDGTLALAECAALTGSKAEAVAILDRYLADLGPGAGDIRLPATLLRKRFAEAPQRRRSVALVTDKCFVGRDADLSAMTMSLRRARWHDGSAVLLHGPPGMGKSRLVAEMVKVAQFEGYHEVVIECRESINARPLGALIEVLPELLASPGAMGCAPESLTVLRKLLGPESERGDTPQEEAPSPDALAALTPAERIELAIRTMRAQSIRHAVVDLFAAVSDERPIFVLIEDVHWLDDASWEVLSDVMQRVNEMRVYVVLTSRFVTIMEERPSRVPTPLTYRKLAPLDAVALSAMIREVADDHGLVVTDEVERWIIAGCEGNPLMLRALLEHWAVTGRADGVPPSLSSLIDQRIDRLDGHAQQALQATSLLGAFATIERVKLVLELPVHDLIRAIEQLEFSSSLSTSHSALVITHNLVREVAVRRISPLTERALRASIADVLEAEYLRTGDLVVLHEALAHTAQSGRTNILYRYLTTYHEPLIEGGRPGGVLSAIATLAEELPHILEERHFEILKLRLNTQAGSYRQAIGSLLGCLRLPDDVSELSVPEVEALVATVDAALRADPVIDRDELSTFSALVARQSNLPVTTRVRAAETGLTATANTCDQVTAAECYFAVYRELESPEHMDASNRIALLYHAIFGDLAKAESVAKAIVKNAERRPASTTIAIDLSRAAFALRLCGAFDSAVTALKRHFEMSLELKLPRLGLYSAWQIAQIDLERGNLESVRAWNAKLVEILKDDDDPISSSFVTAHFCRCAIDERNRSLALSLLNQVKSRQPKLPTRKSSAYVIALELACDLLNTRAPISMELLEAAFERHKQTCSYGTTDFLTSVIADSLCRIGRGKEAAEFISNYTKNARRERGTLSRALLLSIKRAEAN